MTQKKTRFKSKVLISLRDILVAAGCLSVFAASIFLFWKDLNRTYVRSDKSAIATITFKYKVAQRKFSDRVVWERLQQSSPLYNEDVIRTADLAEATIRFNDGTKLELHENSMLQIFQEKDGSVHLSVNDGGIEVDTSDSSAKAAVSVQMENGTVVNLESGSRLAANTAGGEANFQLKSGYGSIVAGTGAGVADGGSGDVIVLEAGETAKITSSGEISKNHLTVTSVSSDLRILNFHEENAVPVKLAWTANSDFEDKEVIIETSGTKNFRTILNKYSVNGNYFELPAATGTTYWRLYEKGSEEDVSSGRIRVEAVPALKVSSPADKTEFKYRTALPLVKFNWTGNDFADRYKLEVSKTPDFSEKILEEEILTQNYNYSNLADGTYFWRVTPYYSINDMGYGESSEPVSFSVVHRQEASAPAPLLPAENATLFYVENAINTTFRWKSDAADCEYDVVVAKDENFENIVYANKVSENRLMERFTAETLPTGNYFWKIMRRASEFDDASESVVRHFKVAVYVPGKNRLLYPPENFAVEKSKLSAVTFAWKLADEFKNSEKETHIQFSKNQNFSVIENEIVSDGSTLTNVDFANGNYFWRIGLYDDLSEKIEYTEPRSFRVLAELSAPEVFAPQQNQTIVNRADNTVRINWKTVSDADLYSIKITDSAGNIIHENTAVNGTNYTFTADEKILKLLKENKNGAKLGITLQPYCEATETQELRTGPVTNVSFVLRNPSPVILSLPASGAEIQGLTAMRTPVEFSWRNDLDVPAKQSFELQKLQAAGNWKTVDTRENPKGGVSIGGLSEGSYRWIVKASMADGTVLNPSYSEFKILPVPELSLPVLSQPAAGFVIDTKYLRKNRRLDFAWKEVPDATEYEFSLFRKNGKRLEHIKTEKVRTNSIRFTELKLLDVGEFEWQVTAVATGRSGSATEGKIERQSKTADGTFKVDIKLPGKIQTKDPGEIFVD